MFSAPILVALMIAGAALAFALERAVRKVREAQARYKAMMAKRVAQVDRLRKAGRESLGLKRELRQAKLAVRDVTLECDRLEAEIKEMGRPENRLFVLDERRMVGDTDWIALVAAPLTPGGFPDPRSGPTWQGERKFRVWASSEEAVRAKVARKYPPNEGYTVTSVLPRMKPVAALPAA